MSPSGCPVLVVDDDAELRAVIAQLLKQEGFDPLQAADGAAALEMIRARQPPVVLLDMRMPGMDGLDVLREARKIDSSIAVIVVTGFGSIPSAVEMVGNGALHYMTKPFENIEMLRIVRKALQSRGLSREGGLRGEEGNSLREEVGASDEIGRVVAEVELVAPTGFSVIILGETGVGKELVARHIHRLSPRRAGPFVTVDCGCIPPTLVESELFGHEKGSFTGAHQTHPGKFEVASGGTLFLDEIQNLPLDVQAKLLRALQHKQVWRVGGTRAIDVDIRVVAATNAGLAGMLCAGRLRADLYYRLNEYVIRVPPLRHRRRDIICLAGRFLAEAAKELEKTMHGFSEEAQQWLLTYAWPGNVRELRNVVRRAALVAGTQITPEDMGIDEKSGREQKEADGCAEGDEDVLPLKEVVRRRTMQVERAALLRALTRTGWNKAAAARSLRVDYKTMLTKMKKYNISYSQTGRRSNGEA